jgi:hypothetical protein
MSDFLLEDFLGGAEADPVRKPVQGKPVQSRTYVGRGRWGSREERQHLSAVMTSARLSKRVRSYKMKFEHVAHKLKEIYFHRSSCTGNQYFRKIGYRAILKHTFQHAGKRFSDIAMALQVTVYPVWNLFLFVAWLVLWLQNNLLGYIVMRAKLAAPELVLLRLAWDETGQGMSVAGQAGIFQIMVARLKLVMAWPSE